MNTRAPFIRKTWLRLLYKGVITTTVCGIYTLISYISHTLVGNKIIDYLDVVGASPVGAAPTSSSFPTCMASMDWAKTMARRDEKHLAFGICCVLYQGFNGSYSSMLKRQRRFSLGIVEVRAWMSNCIARFYYGCNHWSTLWTVVLHIS